MLKRKDQSFSTVVGVLEGKRLSIPLVQYMMGESKLTLSEFRENIGDVEDEDEETTPPLQKLILDQLIAYLSSLS